MSSKLGPRKSVRIKTPQTSGGVQMVLPHFDIANSANRSSVAAYDLRPLEVLRRRLSLSKLKNACGRISTPRRKSSKPRTVVGREKSKPRLSLEKARRLSEGNLLKSTTVVRLQEPFDYSQTERHESDTKPTVRQLQNRSIDDSMNSSATSDNAVSPRGLLKNLEPKKLKIFTPSSGSSTMRKISSADIYEKSESIDPVPQDFFSGQLNFTPRTDACESERSASLSRARRSGTRSLENSVFEHTPTVANVGFRGLMQDVSAKPESNTSFDAVLTPDGVAKGIKIFAQVQGTMIPLSLNKINKEDLIASVKEARKKPVQLNKTSIITHSNFAKSVGTENQQSRTTLARKKAVTISSSNITESAMKTMSSKKLQKHQEQFYNGKWMLNRILAPKEFKTPSKVHGHGYRRHTLASAAKVRPGSSLSSSSSTVSIINTPMPRAGVTEKAKLSNPGAHPKRFQLF